MQYQKVIEQLGYSAREAKVYLVSLRLGEAHITDIAEKVNLPRSSVQIVVDRLHKDGLMNFYVMRRYKYWVAENPEVLLKRLQEREKVIKEALPQLKEIRQESRRDFVRDKQYKKSVDALQMLADASPQAVLVANSNHEIAYVNQSWVQLFGYKLDEVLDKNTRELKSGLTPDRVYKKLWRALRANRLFYSEEVIDRHKDGRHFTVATTIFPVQYGARTFYIQILADEPFPESFKKTQEDFSQISIPLEE